MECWRGRKGVGLSNGPARESEWQRTLHDFRSLTKAVFYAEEWEFLLFPRA
jgi:hypothetical protein